LISNKIEARIQDKSRRAHTDGFSKVQLRVIVRRNFVEEIVVQSEQKETKICLKILGGNKDGNKDEDNFADQNGQFPKQF